ncbi:MAG: mechanosensitive ion channel family protein [Gemmatimonadota bacterium]|nr:MAG: mechanosensitive ion channel family protein [Gemmatimonadota bacterium]
MTNTPQISETTDPGRFDSLTAWLDTHPLVAQVLAIALVVLLAYIVNWIAKRIILATVGQVVKRTTFRWDDVLQQFKVFEGLANLAPAFAVYYGIHLVPSLSAEFIGLVQALALAAMVLIGTRAASRLLSAANEMYTTSEFAEGRTIKGYIQVAKIVLFIVAAVLVIATLTGQSPLVMLGGLGAMTAVLLIVFRDTILSLVASAQISSYDMMRVGDWIEMPQYGADGDVVDIGLHTIKVQNWDKTISAIPTHKFLSDSFKNWRSMSESGGRRIKRAINIDMNSIRFLHESDIERFRKFVLLEDYVEGKIKELTEYNAEHLPDPRFTANARRLTNIGTFRQYVVQYLRQHPKIHSGMTLMVRQLKPTPQGLPLEIYVFSNDVAWVAYEGIQADIFDHIMAIVPEFGLRLYQQPSGSDFEAALRGKPSA